MEETKDLDVQLCKLVDERTTEQQKLAIIEQLAKYMHVKYMQKIAVLPAVLFCACNHLLEVKSRVRVAAVKALKPACKSQEVFYVIETVMLTDPSQEVRAAAKWAMASD